MRTVVASDLGMTICEGTRQASRTENPCVLELELLEVAVGVAAAAAAVSRHLRIFDGRLEESDKSDNATEWQMLAVQEAGLSSSPSIPCSIEWGQVGILELIRRRWLAALVYS